MRYADASRERERDGNDMMVMYSCPARKTYIELCIDARKKNSCKKRKWFY